MRFGPMPSTPNESGNITLPSLPVPDIGPTEQEDKVKNLLEATRPLTELNASLNLMAKEINEGTYRPCWVTKIKFLPDIYLRGEKDERDRINREARQLASNAFNKYKAESLAFLGKEIQATKMAMDSALTTARSFNTKERRQLSKGLSAAIAAEAAKNKEILDAEDNPPQREATNTAHTPTHEAAEEEAAEEGEAEATTLKDIDGTPTKKITFFKTPLNGGGHTFSQEG